MARSRSRDHTGKISGGFSGGAGGSSCWPSTTLSSGLNLGPAFLKLALDAATAGPAGHPQLPSAAPAPAGRPDVHKTATIENDQQGCKGNGGTRGQAIPHGVSPLKSRLVAGHHRAEPFPQGTVGPWKRWWCGGRPITGPYLLKGLPFPLVSCARTLKEGGKCFLHE